MSRFWFGWFGVVIASVTSVASAQQNSPSRPNVLVILADDLGYSDLSCYGSRIETPQLDALASAGMRMTHFYNTARCWPTRSALLTGYYPQQIGFDFLPADPNRGLPSVKRYARPAWATLLPNMIRDVGYRSYHSGKWHLKAMPISAGFDESYLLKDQNRFFSPRVHFLNDVKLEPAERETGYYGTVAIADHAVQTLQQHQANHKGVPFFHFLAFTAPHFPLHALPEDIAKYDGVFDDGWDISRESRLRRMQSDGIVKGSLPEIERNVGPPYHRPEQIKAFGPGEMAFPVPWNELNEVQREFQANKMEIHAAMVDRMDQEIGRVLEQLKAMGVWENTLIVFLSDNGGSAELMIRADGHDPAEPMGSADTHLCLGPGWSMAANTPFRRHKTWVHEGGCHTPFIAHWPNKIREQNGLNHSVCHVIDVVPTILDLAGVEVPDKWDGIQRPPLPGRSFANALSGEELGERSLWWCHDGHRAYREKDWKLVATEGEDWELYDLSHDPTEIHDLSSVHPERVSRMTKAWQDQTDAMRQLSENR